MRRTKLSTEVCLGNGSIGVGVDGLLFFLDETHAGEYGYNEYTLTQDQTNQIYDALGTHKKEKY